jgi:hypothetical protein
MDRVLGTNSLAGKALVTAVRIESDDGLRVVCLWVLTPVAVKIASLEEDERPNARAVVNRKPLDVEHRRCGRAGHLSEPFVGNGR